MPQLISGWAGDCDVVKNWIKNGKCMSHNIVSEVIIMGHKVLRLLLDKIQRQTPAWYSVSVYEATDVNCREQLNLSIRYVDNDYIVSEDPVGLFCLPDTTATTLAIIVKDMLTRSLLLILCGRQAYDGAATMQGIRNGLTTYIKSNCSIAALLVHRLAHSLNLCLYDARKHVKCLRNAVDIF